MMRSNFRLTHYRMLLSEEQPHLLDEIPSDFDFFLQYWSIKLNGPYGLVDFSSFETLVMDSEYGITRTNYSSLGLCYSDDSENCGCCLPAIKKTPANFRRGFLFVMWCGLRRWQRCCQFVGRTGGEAVLDAPAVPVVYNRTRQQDADAAADRAEDGEPPGPAVD